MNNKKVLGLALSVLALSILLLDSRHCDAARFIGAAFIFMPASELLWGKRGKEGRQ